MSRRDRAWVLDDLEQMAVDLQTILDEMSDVDEWTVGELKRVRVLAEAVREGAEAVGLATETHVRSAPSLTASAYKFTSNGHSGTYIDFTGPLGLS